MADHTKHYLISGRVQGVGFRAHVAHLAGQMHLRGWVRNLSDGRVEAVAHGEPALLLSFESRLRTGSPASDVDQVTATDQTTPADLPEEFEVRRTT